MSIDKSIGSGIEIAAEQVFAPENIEKFHALAPYGKYADTKELADSRYGDWVAVAGQFAVGNSLVQPYVVTNKDVVKNDYDFAVVDAAMSDAVASLQYDSLIPPAETARFMELVREERKVEKEMGSIELQAGIYLFSDDDLTTARPFLLVDSILSETPFMVRQATLKKNNFGHREKLGEKI